MRKLVTFVILIAVVFSACKKEETKPQENVLNDGVFIVNQGNFTAGNATLSYYETESGKLVNDLFYDVNNVPLGDVAQSISIDGDLAFIIG